MMPAPLAPAPRRRPHERPRVRARLRARLRAESLAPAALAAGLLALAGCSRPVADSELFPLEEGLRWTYAVTTENSDGTTRETYEVENRGPVTFENGLQAHERRNSRGTRYYLVADATGVYRVAMRSELSERAQMDDTDGRPYVLKAPIKAGTQWHLFSHPYLLRRTFQQPYELKFGKPIMMNYEIASTDASVTVPAGKFDHCVQTVGTHTYKLFTDPSSGFADIPVTSREWYCPKVGMVKLVRSEPVTGSKLYNGGTITYELTEGPR